MPFRGDRLRQVREAHRLSQRDLAALCNIGYALVYRYENSVSEPSFKILTTLAEKLDVSLDYLAGLSDSPYRQPGNGTLDGEVLAIVNAYQHEGWPGVFKLAAEKIAK